MNCLRPSKALQRLFHQQHALLLRYFHPSLGTIAILTPLRSGYSTQLKLITPCRVNPSFSSSNISSNAKTPHSRVPSPLHVPVPVLIVFAPRTLDRAEESRQHHPHLPVELPGRCLYHSSPIFPPKATRRSDISCNSQIPRKSSILYDSLARIIILMADSSLQIQKVYPRSPRPTSLDKVDLGQQ